MRFNIALNRATLAALAVAFLALAATPASALQALESFIEDAQAALDAGDEQDARELVRIASRCDALKAESVEPSESGDQPFAVFRAALALAAQSIENNCPERAMRVLRQLVGCAPRNEAPAYIALENGSVALMPDLFGDPGIQATIDMKELSWTGRLPRKSLKETAQEALETAPTSRQERAAIAALRQRLAAEPRETCLDGANSVDDEEQLGDGGGHQGP